MVSRFVAWRRGILKHRRRQSEKAWGSIKSGNKVVAYRRGVASGGGGVGGIGGVALCMLVAYRRQQRA